MIYENNVKVIEMVFGHLRCVLQWMYDVHVETY